VSDINAVLKEYVEDTMTELRDEWGLTDPDELADALREDLMNRFEMILEEL
jgi:S-adenosylmethionine synthetase